MALVPATKDDGAVDEEVGNVSISGLIYLFFRSMIFSTIIGN